MVGRVISININQLPPAPRTDGNNRAISFAEAIRQVSEPPSTNNLQVKGPLTQDTFTSSGT